jgi:excisionase family DNA binding protein
MPQSSRLERSRMEDLLTVEQAAAKLQIAPKTLKDWLRAGRIKGVRLGKLWRIKERDLEAFVDQGANEDRADITAAEEALANPVRIPYEQTRQKLGL